MYEVMREHDCRVTIVAEPNDIPGNNWKGDINGDAAICWAAGERCTLTYRGRGCLIMEWRGFYIGSVYFSPNAKKEGFIEMLERIGEITERLRGKVIIGGDFNARSKCWDRTYNSRGNIIENWLNGQNLVVINKRGSNTCERPQGSSVVGITICNAQACRKIVKWEVLNDLETLSDHKYIKLEMKGGVVREKRRNSPDGVGIR